MDISMIEKLSMIEKQIADCEAGIKTLSNVIDVLKHDIEQLKSETSNAATDCFELDEYDGYAWVVNYDGEVMQVPCSDLEGANIRYFLNSQDAEEFCRKTEFIAKCMYFKKQFDRDFVPNWENTSQNKWYVIYDNVRRIYFVSCYRTCECRSDIYFSSEEIAQKCANWLNNHDRTNTELSF